MSPMWIIIDWRLCLLNDERKSIDWPLHHRPSSPFLCWSHFKERQSFVRSFFFLLLLLLVLLLLFFLFIRPLQLNDAFCFNNGVLVKESTSCFNDLARSIRRFVVTTSHREFVYTHTHMYSTSTCKEIREENCSSSSSSLPAPNLSSLFSSSKFVQQSITPVSIIFFLFYIQLCHQHCSHIWTSKFPVCQSDLINRVNGVSIDCAIVTNYRRETDTC